MDIAEVLECVIISSFLDTIFAVTYETNGHKEFPGPDNPTGVCFITMQSAIPFC